MWDRYRSVSAPRFTLLAMLSLSTQVWSFATAKSEGDDSLMWLHPAGLLTLTAVLAGLSLVTRPTFSKRAFAVVFVANAALVMAFSPLLGKTGYVAFAAIAVAFAAATMHAAARDVFREGGVFRCGWAGIPVAGPFAALFVAGISEKFDRTRPWSASVRCLPGAFAGLIGVSLISAGMGQYGWILFVFLPVGIGAHAAYAAYDDASDSNAPGGIVAAMRTLTWIYALLAILLLEGLICLVMASVIAYPLAAAGSLFGTWAAKANGAVRSKRLRTAPLLFILPFLGEVTLPSPPPETRTVSTVVEIDAPPSSVWKVMHDLELGPDTDDLLFRSGVAMPVSIRTPEGGGEGKPRECILSTGVMDEVILDWKPERRLEFGVLETPPCMKELGLHGDVEAPHLTGRFRCVTGAFDLEPLSGNRTRLTGTSVVRIDIHPTAYWGLWSDEIVHRVHRRVFKAIAAKAAAAEGVTPPSSRSSSRRPGGP